MKRVKYHPIAREEYLGTLRHYRFINISLGRRFKGAYGRALSVIRMWPEAGKLMRGRVRRMLIGDRFSYGIFYIPDEDELFIVSVLSDRQDPDTWQDRL